MAKKKEPPQRVSFLCGLTAGVATSGLFNPYDRALYLSVKHRRPFLSLENFQTPYQGFLQSVTGRALAGGLYYPLEHAFTDLLVPKDNDDGNALDYFLAGTAAGAMNAILLNPISAVKYKTWGGEVNRGMLHESLSMWRKARLRPFLKGLPSTLLRDVAFGGCYTLVRHLYDGDFGNMVAAGLATIVSGPFNLARNVQYATKSKIREPTIWQVLVKLSREVSSKKSFTDKCHHLQNRLRIGWGTARVAIGMAFGHHVYDQCMLLFECSDS